MILFSLNVFRTAVFRFRQELRVARELEARTSSVRRCAATSPAAPPRPPAAIAGTRCELRRQRLWRRATATRPTPCISASSRIHKHTPPVSSIRRHRNARASALTIALSTRGRGAHAAPSGVTTSFRPPRFLNVDGMCTVIVSPLISTVARSRRRSPAPDVRAAGDGGGLASGLRDGRLRGLMRLPDHGASTPSRRDGITMIVGCRGSPRSDTSMRGSSRTSTRN